jgi:hypothetical protein
VSKMLQIQNEHFDKHSESMQKFLLRQQKLTNETAVRPAQPSRRQAAVRGARAFTLRACVVMPTGLGDGRRGGGAAVGHNSGSAAWRRTRSCVK